MFACRLSIAFIPMSISLIFLSLIGEKKILIPRSIIVAVIIHELIIQSCEQRR